MRILACVAALLAFVAAAPALGGQTRADWSMVGFAGQLTENDIAEIVTFDDVGLRDAYLAGLGVTRRLGSWREMVDFEVEGQIVRHFGDEDNWQFNAAIGPRWTAFPWNEAVPTSVAYLLGLSMASRIPAEEQILNDNANRLLIYFLVEVEAGLPEQPWAGFFRIHHRSSGLGRVFEGGGSNWLVLGVRRFF